MKPLGGGGSLGGGVIGWYLCEQGMQLVGLEEGGIRIERVGFELLWLVTVVVLCDRLRCLGILVSRSATVPSAAAGSRIYSACASVI